MTKSKYFNDIPSIMYVSSIKSRDKLNPDPYIFTIVVKTVKNSVSEHI